MPGNSQKFIENLRHLKFYFYKEKFRGNKL